MSDSKENKDQEKGDEVLKRMLKTPPKRHVNEFETDSSQKKKLGEASVKKQRPEDQ